MNHLFNKKFSVIVFSFILISLFNTKVVNAESTFVFNNDLKMGDVHADVKELQKYFNSNGLPISLSGVGSLGKENTSFGTKTKKAVILFQKANLISSDGIVGPITRGIINIKNTKVESKSDTTNVAKTASTVVPPGYMLMSGNLVRLRGGGSTRSIVTYTLSYIAGTGGTISGTSSQTVNSGSNGSAVTAVPNTGYVFDSWSDGVMTATRTDSSITANKSVSANFIAVAPSALSYTSPNLFIKDTAIITLSPTVTGTAVSYSVSPDLPLGLAINTSNGQITGIPTSSTAQATYTVTATNAGGSTTFGVVIMVDGTVVGANGKVWLDRNLGATRVATASTDSLSYGDLYQWGRPADGHQVRTSSTASGQVANVAPGTNTFIIPNEDWSSTDSDGTLRSANWDVNGSSNPCPSGFRLPTNTELETERTSWSSNNSTGAFASPLKLPVAGYRNYSDGSLGGVGITSNYWTSTADGANSRSLDLSGVDAYTYSNTRAYGFTVRCIANTATAPNAIVLDKGSVNAVGVVANVAIPLAGATDTTGSIAGWVANTANKIKFSVTDTSPASSSITINGSAYSSGTDYSISSLSTITIVVTTSEINKATATRTFLIPVSDCFAIGGTQTKDGNFCVHSFTSSGSLYLASDITANVLVVAGGGGGGDSPGGGGGAGGYRHDPSFLVAAGTHAVTVGDGGTGGAWNVSAPTNGGNSQFSTITSTGGGGGGQEFIGVQSGGSGGGGMFAYLTGASGNTPSVSPSQGNNGGSGRLGGGDGDGYSSGGGGGAGSVGEDASASKSGNGGAGTANSISGSSVVYAGGGGGGADSFRLTGPGTGGSGGGGNGGDNTNGANGTANTGGGGGGGSNGASTVSGGNGGSGIVIVRYRIAEDTPVNIPGILGVTAPVTGATPVSTITQSSQYTGTVTWAPTHSPFGGGTIYTATITLTPKPFYTLTGVATNYFTVSGATATNPINSGVITAVFSSTSLAIGDSYQGGKVAYIFQSGDTGYVAGQTHGLIAATANQSSGIVWAVPANQTTDVTGADGTLIGTGNQNTIDIVAQNGSDSTFAAGLCSNLVEGGYDDWYLPSKDELNKLYINKTAIGGFLNGYFWSSSESAVNPSSKAWFQEISDGSQWGDHHGKSYTKYVRAVRSF